MPIYSNNRTGSMALAQVAANESYTSEDFGRILYESQLNDMAFFEAVLACDFKEIKGLREGTILEAEVNKLNKETINQMINNIIEGLKKFWAKLKGVFADAINKLAAYVMKDGNAIKAEFKKANVSKWEGSVENVKVFQYRHKCLNFTDSWLGSITNAYNDENTNVSAIVGSELGKLVGQDSISSREYSKAVMELCVENKTLNKSNVDEFASALDKGAEHIRFLKEYQKKTEKSINEAIKTLKEDAKKDGHSSAAKLNAVVRAYETILAITTKATITVVRADMRSRAAALTKALHTIKNTITESADMEVMCVQDSFDEAMTGILNMDAETKTAVAELVAAC